jgi:hypothetical protein
MIFERNCCVVSACGSRIIVSRLCFFDKVIRKIPKRGMSEANNIPSRIDPSSYVGGNFQEAGKKFISLSLRGFLPFIDSSGGKARLIHKLTSELDLHVLS